MWNSYLSKSFQGKSSRRSLSTAQSKIKARRAQRTLESLENRCLLAAAGYLEMNLVSNQAGAALLQDPALNLPWGIAVAPAGGNFWIADTGSGAVTLYGGDVNGKPLTEDPMLVKIPGGFPTADVFNSTSDFSVSNSTGASGPATFLFASLDGKISAWSQGVSGNEAQTVAQVSGAYFTGLALGNDGSGNMLYAADFQNGKIDVFDGNFQPTTLAGSFTDPNLPAGYAPFNIQNIGGKLYVTYAAQQTSSGHSSDQDGDDQGGGEGEDSASQDHNNGGQSDDDADNQNGGVLTPAATGGIVDVFDMNGNLLNRFATGGTLNAPWGLAMAPASFGDFQGDLLVGNFGDGRISAFKPDGTYAGQLTNAAGNPISINHLLGLSFGNGATAGDAGTLYFTADAAKLSNGLTSANNGIVLLDSSGAGALREVGNASVSVAGGAISVDSSNAGAVFLAGNPSLSASQLNVVGTPGLTEHGHPNVNLGAGVNFGATTELDPLLSLSAPAAPANTLSAVSAGNYDHMILQPGLYDGGISVDENATVTLMPGTYYVKGGISVEGQGRLQGQGVTIYVVSNGNDPAVKVEGQGVIDLTAPTSGDLQGVALFLARSDVGGVQIEGQGRIDLTGALYAPSATVNVAGNGKLLLASDAQNNIGAELIAADLNVAGNGTVNVGASANHGPFSLFGSLQPADAANPLTALGASLAATEGFVFQGAVAAVTDAAAAAAADLTATIDWGDGTSTTGGAVTSTGNGGFLVSGHHVYAEQGSFNIVVTLNDKSGNTITAADAVQVSDAPLLAVGTAVKVSQGLSASNVTVASFVDTGGADAAGDYTATIDWGDGTTTSGTVSLTGGALDVVGSHDYAAAGQYPVKVTITDEGGATATANSVALLGSSTFDADDIFVEDAFQDILNRPVDQAGLQFFVNALQHGMTRQQFAATLTNSTEYLENKIRADYQHYLGRNADDGGLAFWLALLRGGMTDEQLEANFIGSPEYFQHSGGTNKSWVDEMYFDLLGRLPDAQGEAYWIQVLGSGGSRSQVALGFASSSEREGITVQNDYQTFLSRNPASSEVDGWVNSFRHGTTNEQVVAGFVGSPEYFNRHGGDQGGGGQGNGGQGGGHGSHGGD